MEHYDLLETESAAVREARQMAALSRQVAHVRASCPGLAGALSGVDAAAITDRSALASLPVTRKAELAARQQAAPPFGGLNGMPLEAMARVFQSPGSIYEPEGRGRDYWRMARAMYAAGFRAGQLVHNTFSYHFTPAGSMMESGAHALGCVVFPAGVGQTEQQVAALAHLRPACYAGTPSFLRIILEKAAELGVDHSSLRHALVSGEALPASLRTELGERGVAVLQAYATADVGLIAYETPALEGLVVDEGVIVEIVRPGTGDPVPEGEVGEVLVTSLAPEYPLLRLATGDLSAVLPGASPCGRTNTRIRGWMGRADQTAKVRGLFVHPSQVAQVLSRHPELGRGRLVVDREGHNDVMTLRCECAVPAAEGLAAAVVATLREVTKLRAEVELLAPGALPNDGRVIDDVRRYD